MQYGLGNLYLASDAESRSITAENPTGAKGRGGMATKETTLWENDAHPARELGVGWKLSPCATVKAGETFTVADIEGPGVIRHMWFTLKWNLYRDFVLRIYWNGDEAPSVECPIGDFFCNCWNQSQNILAQPINVNPHGGLNCYFPMPFRRNARITLTNESPTDKVVFYAVNYTLEQVPDTALYFHAYWRRTNPVPYGQFYTILDDVRGKGQYVGTFMAWQQNNSEWWGEGEILMFMDGDKEYPTIIGTGTEDYFGGAWCFANADSRESFISESFTAPYLGYIDVQPEAKPGNTRRNMRAGCRSILYRFHVHDPIFFKSDLKVQMQCIGWRDQGRFLPLQDDVSSVAYWYQTLPHAPFPPLLCRDKREIV